MPHRITEGPNAGALAVSPDEFDRIVAGIDQPIGTVLAEDWDAFWHEVDRPPAASVTIKGRVITLPSSVPLRTERLLIEAQGAEATEETARRIVGAVLGADLLDWLIDEAEVDAEQLMVLMVWAAANVGGKSTTLAEARKALAEYQADEVSEAAAGSPGKAGPKAPPRSSGTGRRSSGTSARSGA